MVVCGLLHTMAFGQAEKVKAVFIYKFAQYTQWPSQAGNGGEFVIMVAGDVALEQQIEGLLAGRSVHDRQIVVKPFDPSSVAQADLLYVGEPYLVDFSQFQQAAFSGNVLLVTHADDGVQGAHINFVQTGNKMQFELDADSLESAGLRAQSTLRTLARNR